MKNKTSSGPPPDLSKKEWEFCCKTPGGGDEFWNKSADMVAVKYYSRICVYSDREKDIPESRRPYPCDYNLCTHYNL